MESGSEPRSPYGEGEVEDQIEQIQTHKDRLVGLLNELAELRKAKKEWEDSAASRKQELEGQLEEERVRGKKLKERLAAKSVLQVENEKLQDDVDELKDELVRKDILISTLNKSMPPYKHAHPIALRFIFEATVPTAGLLNPSFGSGPNSAWCHTMWMKKSLSLVCKEWQEAALPLLYGDIVLRRVGQLPALVRTIRSNTDLFCPLIKSISFAFHVPKSCRQLTTQNMAYILENCSNIRTLSFLWGFVDRPLDDTLCGMSPEEDSLVSALRKISPDITKLEYYDNELSAKTIVLPIPLISAFPNLVSLTISIPLPVSKPEEVASHTMSSFSLERLEYLCIWHRPCGDSITLAAAATSWHLPRLTRLAFRWCEFIPAPCSPVKLDQNIGFVQKHGHHITSLDLGPYWANHWLQEPSCTQKVKVMIDLCPKLQHLVLCGKYAQDQIFCALFTERLTLHVDIWTTCVSSYYNSDSGRPIMHIPSHLREFLASKPSLSRHSGQNVRFIDRSLDYLPDLPRILPPDPLEGGSEDTPPRIHCLYDSYILQTDWCLFRHDDPDWIPVWDVMSMSRAPQAQGDSNNVHDNNNDDNADSQSVKSDDSDSSWHYPSSDRNSLSSDEDSDYDEELEAAQAEALQEIAAEQDEVEQLTEEEALSIFAEDV